MNALVHFEIQAAEPERAAKFYTEVFGWKIDKYPGLEFDYWGIVTKDEEGNGINGGLLKRPSDVPSQQCGANAFVCTVQVEDYEAMAKKIEAAGGMVAMPKFALKGMAWQGYFLDTEGNTIGLHQTDVNAA
jgi:predicted enzyme related to lactoylglutathione lyase